VAGTPILNRLSPRVPSVGGAPPEFLPAGAYNGGSPPSGGALALPQCFLLRVQAPLASAREGSQPGTIPRAPGRGSCACTCPMAGFSVERGLHHCPGGAPPTPFDCGTAIAGRYIT
jgi:hypothetical protein